MDTQETGTAEKVPELQIPVLECAKKIEGMRDMKAIYELESDLVKDFQNILLGASNPLAIIAMASEFNYVEGKADLIAKNSNGDLVAFEAKLTRWRNALNQAYRNSSFAHYSYVVIPDTTSKNVLSRIHEFHRRGVGLCSLGPSGIRVVIPASRKNPIQPWLTDVAQSCIDGR